MAHQSDAIVVGSGPNGLAAAIRLAQAGLRVTILEANTRPGGAVRSSHLTLPTFIHDSGASVFPAALASPFFRSLDLASHGLEWLHPPAPLAHPLDDGSAVMLYRSVEETASRLGTDEDAYRSLLSPFVAESETLISDLLAPPRGIKHPAVLARFGVQAFRSAVGFAASHFHDDRSRALLAGNAAHSFLRMDEPLTAGYGLFLMLLGHACGWPIVRGGAGNLTAALVAVAERLGVTIEMEHPVRSMRDIPGARAVLFDTSPDQIATIAGKALPAAFRRGLRRHRFGPGVFKIDYALAAPVPWIAPECASAGTIHLGGNLEEIAISEAAVTRGDHPDHPFVIASQPSLFDPTRAPEGKHILWAYCHVPAGSTMDMTGRIERQIARFAPGFQELVLARHSRGPAELHAANANLVGGAINGGRQDIRAYLSWALGRPSPYATPNPLLFRCSGATPPGGGVHGMSGFHAAEQALASRFHAR